MSISLCILASGSSGNCAVLRTGEGRVMLIDAGLSPRATGKRLAGTGVSIDAIEAICLTHLDGDHYHRGWNDLVERNGIRVHLSLRQRAALAGRGGRALDGLMHGFDDNPFEPVRGVCATRINLRHDEMGSSGFVFSSGSTRLGYATDLGRVPRHLVEAFAGVDLLAIESNYDPSMQLRSARPAFLKNRIMGGRGHLSNPEAFDAVRRILDASDRAHGRLPSHVVLLHRSRECNCPKLLRELFHQDPRLPERLVLAEQFERTEWLSPRSRPVYRGEQLSFGWTAGAVAS